MYVYIYWVLSTINFYLLQVGSCTRDIDTSTKIDIDVEIDSDIAASMNWGVLKRVCGFT